MPLELGRPIWVESNVDPEAHLHHAVLEAPDTMTS
jgi:hypothetical protein